MDTDSSNVLPLEGLDNIPTDNEEKDPSTEPNSHVLTHTVDIINTTNVEKASTSDEGKFIKHCRYWSSWEEITLVELWYEYKNEIGDSKKPCASYQTIGSKMRSKGFDVTAQECQRKIRSYIVKYLEAKERPSKFRSKWRLYPIVDYIISQGDGTNEVKDNEEETVIRRRLMKANGPSAIEEENHQDQANMKRNSSRCSQRTTSGKHNLIKSSSFLQKICTKANLQQLHDDNRRLASRRDNDLQRLEIETHHLFLMEMLLPKLLVNNEQFLRYVEKLKEKLNNKRRTSECIAERFESST